MGDTYTHGHHESVLRSHTWRTAENSAGHLLAHLEAGQSLLDVGCGPGTITIDLARRVAPGPVLGIDLSDDVIAAADQAARESGLENVAFAVDDVYDIEAADGAFAVVHAHQVLQHLTDPVAALRELGRVLTPDGVLAVRDSDYDAFTWAPADPLLDRWLALYHDITRHNGAEADAGRRLFGWAQQAGLEVRAATSSTWTFADPGSRSWWGGLWADRVTTSAFATQAVAYDLSDAEELAAIAAAWRRWAEQPDGWFAVLHGEVIATTT